MTFVYLVLILLEKKLLQNQCPLKPSLTVAFNSVHRTLFRSVGSLRGPTEFCESYAPKFCEKFIKEKLLIFIKESTFVNVAKPRNGWFGHKNGSKYGFLGKFGQKSIL